MRYRILVAMCAGALAALPASASACPSLAHVQSFAGIAHVGFVATASGDDGEEGIQTIRLDRGAGGIHLELHRSTVGHGLAVFAGQATGGDADVDDTFVDSNNSLSGHAQYSGPLKEAPPSLGEAFLMVNTHTCKYQVSVNFGVETTFTGNLPEEDQPNPLAGGGASSAPKLFPASLKLNGAAAPDAYDNCTGAIEAGQSCFTFTGGWTTEFEQLALCHAVSGSTCKSSKGFSFGVAGFAWHLKPSFKKPKKK